MANDILIRTPFFFRWMDFPGIARQFSRNLSLQVRIPFLVVLGVGCREKQYSDICVIYWVDVAM